MAPGLVLVCCVLESVQQQATTTCRNIGRVCKATLPCHTNHCHKQPPAVTPHTFRNCNPCVDRSHSKSRSVTNPTNPQNSCAHHRILLLTQGYRPRLHTSSIAACSVQTHVNGPHPEQYHTNMDAHQCISTTHGPNAHPAQPIPAQLSTAILDMLSRM